MLEIFINVYVMSMCAIYIHTDIYPHTCTHPHTYTQMDRQTQIQTHTDTDKHIHTVQRIYTHTMYDIPYEFINGCIVCVAIVSPITANLEANKTSV